MNVKNTDEVVTMLVNKLGKDGLNIANLDKLNYPHLKVRHYYVWLQYLKQGLLEQRYQLYSLQANDVNKIELYDCLLDWAMSDANDVKIICVFRSFQNEQYVFASQLLLMALDGYVHQTLLFRIKDLQMLCDKYGVNKTDNVDQMQSQIQHVLIQKLLCLYVISIK